MPLTSEPGLSAERRDPSGERPRTELLAEIATLRGILASAPVIEQAKGAIMLCRRMTADTAFTVLRRHSQQHNIKIRDLAAQVAGTLSTRSSTSPARDLISRLLAEHAPPETSDGRSQRGDHPRAECAHPDRFHPDQGG